MSVWCRIFCEAYRGIRSTWTAWSTSLASNILMPFRVSSIRRTQQRCNFTIMLQTAWEAKDLLTVSSMMMDNGGFNVHGLELSKVQSKFRKTFFVCLPTITAHGNGNVVSHVKAQHLIKVGRRSWRWLTEKKLLVTQNTRQDVFTSLEMIPRPQPKHFCWLVSYKIFHSDGHWLDSPPLKVFRNVFSC